LSSIGNPAITSQIDKIVRFWASKQSLGEAASSGKPSDVPITIAILDVVLKSGKAIGVGRLLIMVTEKYETLSLVRLLKL
jgi:hypothetical protein